MFEYKTIRGWTAAGTMDRVDELKERGWEVVSTHPRFVVLIPFLLPVGEFFGLQALLRRDVATVPMQEEWIPNNTPEDIGASRAESSA